MALGPWIALATLSALLWWPGSSWEAGPPELIAMVLLGMVLTGGWRALLVALPVACTLLQADRHLADRLPARLDGRDFLVRGQVCDFPRQSGRAARFAFHLDPDSRTQGLPPRVQLAWYEASEAPRAGETWWLKVRLREIRGAASPGAFDFERVALVDHIGARGYVRASALNRRVAAGGWQCPTMPLRAWLAQRVTVALGEHIAAPYLLAVTVGARQGLERGDWARLRHTGTAHLMAISGLHIGLVAGFALLLGRGLACLLVGAGWRASPRQFSLLLALLGGSVYAALAGFALPTRRAVLMLATWVLLSLYLRGATAWATLATALWLVLVTDGLTLLTPGFWLSFGAVVALLTATLDRTPAPGHSRPVRWAQGLLGAQWRVFVGLAPIAWLCFGEVALVSPLANLVAVPLFGLAIMPLAMLGLIGLAAGWSQAPLLHWAADLIAVLLGFLDWLDWGAWQGPALVAQWLPVAVIAAAALLWPRPLPGRACALGLLLAVPFLGSRGPPAGDFRIMVLDVGQGLAVVVQTHTHALVYDAGPAYGAGDAGHSVVLPALRATGVRRLHALVVSHSDMDHAGGALSVHSAFPRAAVLAPEPVRGVPVVHDCHAGQAWRWDGVVFRILHPPDGPRRGPQNDQSCVLLISTPRGGSVLLPGDISRRAEPRVIDRLPAGPLDLVIAPHHGSASSSTAAFVAATRPRYVVFAAGYRNRWDFPRPSVATRWRRSGACLLNTASDGTLRFQTGPSGLRLRSRYRADAARWWSASAATPACGDAHPAL